MATAFRENREEPDVIVVGAGFAGLYMLYRLRQMGLSAIGIEAASGVGGTWWWNRYPGARCDIRSLDYSYSFDPDLEQEWEWSEKYATQPEILAYANHVADRHDLRRDIRFNTKMTDARWNHDEQAWIVTTDQGETWSPQFLVMAVGALSAASHPNIDGVGDFAGELVHTAHWPHSELDLAGKRVAVIGTGSSGIQSIPIIAEQALHLTVFQRTPNFAVPAQNGPLDPEAVAELKHRYREHRAAQRRSYGGVINEQSEQSAFEVDAEERIKRFDAIWDEGNLFGFLGSFNDVMFDPAANDIVADYLRERIRGIVNDPETAELLCPTTYPVGAKRLCLDSGYFQTFNRPNVRLVDLQRTPIRRIVADGIETTEETFDFDVIVFATGFDAMTGPLLGPKIIGEDVSLREAWDAGPRTYLGIMSHGFPNLFMITAPGSPSVLTNMIVSIEQHVEWTTELMDWMQQHSKHSIDPDLEAQDAWVEHVNEIAEFTLFPKGNSWYLGANVPGKPRVFMPYIAGVDAYREVCEGVAADGYRGFSLR